MIYSTSAAVDSVWSEHCPLRSGKMPSDVCQGKLDINCLKKGLASTNDVVGERQKNIEQMEDINTNVKVDISFNQNEVASMLEVGIRSHSHVKQ